MSRWAVISLLTFGCSSFPADAELSARSGSRPELPGRASPAARRPETSQAAPTDLVAVVREVSPPARTDPFPGRTTVTVGELLDQVAAEIAVVETSASVREDYERLLLELGLPDDEELRRDYVRIKLAFEATRAGGLWGIEWDITNELPQSDLIWRQWQALELDPEAELPTTTAIAECDELSALFAYVAHRIGLSKRSEVGLFWPTGNHTVAVWTIDRRGDDPKRIVVPTSQIFLEPMDSLGTHGFNPRKQRKIFDYRTADIELTAELPAELARRFAWAVEDHGAHSQADLQQRRNERERRQWADDTLSE